MNDNKQKSSISTMPKQAVPVKRPVTGIDHDAPAVNALCVGPSGEVGVSPAGMVFYDLPMF